MSYAHICLARVLQVELVLRLHKVLAMGGTMSAAPSLSNDNALSNLQKQIIECHSEAEAAERSREAARVRVTHPMYSRFVFSVQHVLGLTHHLGTDSTALLSTAWSSGPGQFSRQSRIEGLRAFDPI